MKVLVVYSSLYGHVHRLAEKRAGILQGLRT